MKPQLLLLTFCVLMLAVSSQGQQTTPPSQPTVRVSFSVTDASGRAVNDLKVDDIQVFDEASPVKVQSLSQETAPVMYGLLIDRSGSLKPHFSSLLDVAKQVIAANGPSDQTFLMSFVSSDKMEIMQEVTSDTAALNQALNLLKVEGGQTALIDAVYVSAQYAMKHQPATNYRVALVLLSDGEERASFYREQQLMELLGRSKIQIFVVALVSDLDDESGLIRQSPRRKATDLAMRLAHGTGGDAFILKSSNELTVGASLLTTELHSQYALGYTPTKKIDKNNRKVEIKLTKSPQHQKWRLVVGNVTTEAQK